MGLEHQGQHQHGHSGRARRGAAEEQSKQLLFHHCCFRRRLMIPFEGIGERIFGGGEFRIVTFGKVDIQAWAFGRMGWDD